MHRYRDQIRFADIDRLGHLNNVAYAVYLESARVALLEELSPGSTAGIEAENWTIVRLEIDFLAPGHYPADIEVTTALGRIGGASLALDQEIRAGGTLVARAASVCVWTDIRRGRAVRLPDAMRAALVAHAARTSGELLQP